MGWRCRNKYNERRTYRGYRKYLKDACEICGFQGHRCQLDINHRDGNHSNNDPENLQTACANCHRLITYEQSLKRLDGIDRSPDQQPS